MRKLTHDGWSLARVRGSHHYLHHPAKPGTINVAIHGSEILPPGTLRGIIRSAGLTVAEFITL